MKTQTMKTPQFIDPKQVRRVYVGRSGCMCGCAGKYTENPEHRDEILKARPTADLTFDAPGVLRTVRKMNERIAELMSGGREMETVEFEISPLGVHLQDNKTDRCWFAYFTL